jgi:ubiquinone/menaquinone biosynthesis C-methylase UbiE
MNCDAIAPWYRWLEYAGFGRALERRREAFLSRVADARRVLALGDGDGRALAALLRANAGATVDSVDASAGMLELARARVGRERVAYHHADALTMPLEDGAYDLVVTHFLLDCFEAREQARLIERVARAASAEARWVVSEFRGNGMLVALLYWFFRITTGLRTRELADHRALFERHGFRLERAESAWGGRLASELWVRASS